MEQNGFRVLKRASLGIKKNLKIGQLTPTVAGALADRAFPHNADAVFVSCTNFRTFEAITALEQKLCKPFISSNSATLWASLRVFGSKCTLELGQLFEE